MTATELKRLEAEDTPPEDAGAPLLKGAPRTQAFRRPDFSARERRLTAAERGTATHRTLQYLHFADARTPEGIAAQVQALAARGLLTAREAQAVNTASLLQLMRTPLGAALAAAEVAGTLRREFRFSLLCPAETFFPGADEEQVLLQGVVDAWFETKDGLVIVDYKTDRIRPGCRAGAHGVLCRAAARLCRGDGAHHRPPRLPEDAVFPALRLQRRRSGDGRIKKLQKRLLFCHRHGRIQVASCNHGPARAQDSLL